MVRSWPMEVRRVAAQRSQKQPDEGVLDRGPQQVVGRQLIADGGRRAR
jgi:hypothetical protein